jgi:iron(III) transport system substrate-binding protein
VCDAAKAEGKVVFWHNLAKPDVIAAEFNKTYPNIQVEWLQSRPDAMVQALMTEVSTGRKPSADVLYGELNILKTVFDANADDDTIDWAGLGAAKEILTDAGNAVRVQRVLGGLVYSTTALKKEDLPNTWAGLLDQKWKGQLVVDSRARPFDQLALVWGHDATIAYVKALLTNQPLVINGGTAGMLAVAGGQAKITTGGRSESTAEEKSKGAPLEIKYLEVIPTFDAYNMVPKGAPHPNAAKCIVSWLATDGAPAFEKAEFKQNVSRPAGASASDTLVTVDTPDKATTVANIGSEIQKLYAGTAK